MNLWSIRHRSGWCAASYKSDPGGKDRIGTLCRYWIMLPWGCEPGVARVDCPECRDVLGQLRGPSRSAVTGR